MNIFKEVCFTIFYHLFFILTFFLLFPLERGGERKERERNIDMREKHQISCFLHMPRPGTTPATQACSLTRNQTGYLSLCWMTPSQLRDTSQGSPPIFEKDLTVFYQQNNTLILTKHPPPPCHYLFSSFMGNTWFLET